EPLIRLSQDHVSGKVRIPVGRVGLISIAGSGSIGANQGCERESSLSSDDAVPLPAADQLIYNSTGAASEALAAPKRQLIAEVAIKLMVETVGRNSSIQL